MADTHLNITLVFVQERGASFDLRIPRYVTVQELVGLVRESLDLAPLEEAAHAKIERNQQLLSGMDYIHASPLRNGDKLFII